MTTQEECTADIIKKHICKSSKTVLTFTLLLLLEKNFCPDAKTVFENEIGQGRSLSSDIYCC